MSVVIGAFPILTSSVLALAAAVLSGTLAPAKAYAGFANGTILLIVVAFLVARAVVKCGLGERLGHLVVSAFGRSTLGLGYSIFLVDGVIAPAFPSNTARSGVLYPLVLSVAEAAGSRPGDESKQRLGSFLMFSGIASLTVSSALWFTAMAGNPLGAEIARGYGLQIGFGSWFVASSIPTLVAMALLPLLLYKVTAPEVTATPEAPRAARRALAELGPLRAPEKIVAATFVGMVALWAAAASLGLDSTAVAFLGLGVLLATGVLTLADIAKEGDVLATFIWFAVLFTLSGQLNELGFMGYLGERLAGALGGLSAGLAGVVLVVAYVLLHYLFVSQTAHLLALFGVFLDVGVKLGRPGGAARVPAAVRDQLLLGQHAAGLEREPAVRRERLPVAGRALPARRAHHRLQSRAVPRRRDPLADPGDPMTSPKSSASGGDLMTCKVRCAWALAVLAALVAVPALAADKLPSVVVLATGGTIAGAAASDVQAGYTSGQVGVDQLLAAVPQAKKLATLRGEQIANIGSQDMNDEVWLKLARRVNELVAMPDVDGIVITHGTDTIEETAYFLNLVVKSRKPVVLTAAMRPSTALSADGPLNLLQRRRGGGEQRRGRSRRAGRGQRLDPRRLLAHQDQHHGGADVPVAAAGLVGTVAYGEAEFYRGPVGKNTVDSEFSLDGVTALPRVDIVMAHENMDGAIIDAAVAAGAKGVVIAGVGNGNMTKAGLDALAAQAKKGVVCVRSTRVATGRVGRNVEVDDDKLGLIASDDLNPQKARVLLRLALLKPRSLPSSSGSSSSIEASRTAIE